MNDLIERQALIDAFWELDVEIRPLAINAIIDMIRTLPSAEMPKRTGKSTQNVPNDDLVSRKAAIDAVEGITSSMSICVNLDECHGMKRMQRQAVIELANLPPAQPDISKDGTLTVTVPKGSDVKRVLVQEKGSTYGALFYKDSQLDIVYCHECRHFDEDNGVCKVDGNGGWQADDYCSTGQRREG